jgi:hypothetical protein
MRSVQWDRQVLGRGVRMKRYDTAQCAALLLALLSGCPRGESAEEAYRRGQDDLRQAQLEQVTCRDGEVYPSSDWDPFAKRTHLCVRGYWIAIAAERRADLPRSCEPPMCVTFGAKP